MSLRREKKHLWPASHSLHFESEGYKYVTVVTIVGYVHMAALLVLHRLILHNAMTV